MPPKPRSAPAWSPAAKAVSAPAPSKRQPAPPTQPAKATPDPYHNTAPTPPPSPPPARPHKPPPTSPNNPNTTHTTPLKFLALGSCRHDVPSCRQNRGAAAPGHAPFMAIG